MGMLGTQATNTRDIFDYRRWGGGGGGEGGSPKLPDEQVGKRDQNLTFYSVISCAKVQQGY